MKISMPIKVEFDDMKSLINDLGNLQTYKLSEGDEMTLVDIADVADVLAKHVKAMEAERNTGRWIKDEKSYAGSGLSNYLCDQCGECGGTWRSDLKPHQFPKFCMWCGSPMEVEHETD